MKYFIFFFLITFPSFQLEAFEPPVPKIGLGHKRSVSEPKQSAQKEADANRERQRENPQSLFSSIASLATKSTFVPIQLYEHDVSEEPIQPAPEPFFDPSLIPQRSKEERRAEKMANRRLLWEHVQNLAKEHQGQGAEHFDKIIISGNLRDLLGFTCATAAATHSCFFPILELLSRYGANFNVKDALDLTPLETAVIGQRARNVTFLLNHGATLQPSLISRICNPSQDALKPGKMARVKTLEALLKAGANPNQFNENGNNPNNPIEFLLRHSGQKNLWMAPNKDELHKKFLEQRKLMISHLLNAGLLPHFINAALDSTVQHSSFYDLELISFLKEEMAKQN